MEILVEFVLLSENFPIDEVNNQIGLPCSESIKKGDILHIGPNKDVLRVQTCSSLTYSTGYISTINVEEPLQKIYELLLPKKEQITELVEKYSLIAKFCIVINLSENPIIGLSSEFIKLASDIHAEIEFDTYIQGQETENESAK